MIGIYKITSPKNRIYIGQSININMRFYRYRKLQCKSQIKLYNSLSKHGVENHKFEIICICSIDDLNKNEVYYINFYKSTDSNLGLNCKTGGSNGVPSEQTRLKMSIAAKGRTSPMKGRKQSAEARKKMSESKKGMVSPRKGVKLNENQKKLLGSYQIGIKQSEETKQKRVNSSKGKINCRKIIDEKKGTIYNSITQASELLGYKATTLNAMLSGQNKNKTNLKYL